MWEILKNDTKWIKIVHIVHSFIQKSQKEFGLNSLTPSKVIERLIFTKFTHVLMQVRRLIHNSR
jgi:hypothetical protein